MTKAEKAEQYFRNTVSDAMTYMSEAKTACGSDMQQLEYYDLAAKALRRTAEYDKAESEGRVVVLPCKVGTPIWWIDVSIEPNERGKWVTRNRIKSMKFDHSVLDWIDTPFYLTRAEAEAALGGGGE